MSEKVVIGNAELWHGDCREILPTLPECDLILTDPPYGIGVCNRSDGGVGSIASGSKVYGREQWDKEAPPAWLFGLMQEQARWLIIWGGNYYDLPPSQCWLAWDKGQRDFTFADGELAWTNLEKAVRFLTVPRGELVAEGKDHPTQKPLRLMEWCLAHAPKAVTVCDPFMGSGTTGVACANLGKAFTGIERERKYFDIACERISRAQAQGTLLTPEKPPEPVQEGLL